MKQNFSKKLLASILCIAMLLNSSSVAFATDADSVGSTPTVATSETVVKDEEITSEDKTPPSEDKTPPAEEPVVPPTETLSVPPEQPDCTCPPVDSGEVVHGEDCPLYEAPEAPTASDAVKAVEAQIQALAAAADAGEAPDADAVKAARAAYDALTDEEKAAFDADALAKLTALEKVLAAMPVLMAGDIPVLDANSSYQNVKYTLTTGSPTGTAAVSGVVDNTALTGVNNVLTIPTQVQTSDGTVYNVTSIGSSAFQACTKLTSVVIPSSVTSIEDNAFEKCTSLATLSIPSSVQTIKHKAFDQIEKGAVVTLEHTGSLPTNINYNSFETSGEFPFYVVAEVAVAEALAPKYLKNNPYGMIVSAAPDKTSFEDVNSDGTLKARTSLTKLAMGRYDVAGVKDGGDILTTYNGAGYASYLSIGDDPSYTGSSSLRLPGAGVEGYVKDGIWAKVETEFVSGGKYLRVTYTLRNNTNAAIDKVALGVHADVQIGKDDYASIYPTPTGFRLVNTKAASEDSIGSGMQFTLNCTNAPGADNVSTMWYGNCLGIQDNLFTDLADKVDLIDEDSALAFSWQGMSIPANDSITRSVVFGVGEAAVPPALPTDPTQKPIALYLTTSGQKDITVNAKVTDTASFTDTLYYTINGGEEKTLGETVIADGTEKTIAGVITADNFMADDTYTVKLWIMNSKGAMSEVITKVLTVSSGAMGGAGLEIGTAPVPPSGGGTVECTCVVSAPTFANGSVAIPADQASTTYALSASGSALSGSCAVEGHSGATVTYSYAEKTDASSIATVSGSTLTVTGAGDATITATATANGKTATTDATFTVTKAAAAKITVTGTCNGDSMDSTGGTSLQDAVTNAVSGLGTLAQVTELTITAGTVTTDDWKSLKTTLPALQTFAIADVPAVTSVADIPAGTVNSTIFPKSIVSVTIPQAIAVGNYAFFSCKALTSVSLPVAKTIGESAFNDCILLTSVSLPEVTNIGARAFYYCKSLVDISLPKATSIGSNTFQSCTSLTSVNLSAATSIDKSVFESCSALAGVNLPKATTIGELAFSFCTSLTTVSLPAVTSIGESAFFKCTSLATLKLGTTVPTVINANAFKNCPATRSLTFVGADGTTELTDTDLTNAQAKYDAVNDLMVGSTATDGLWYGWKVREPVAAAKITITVNGGATPYDGTSLSDAVTNAVSGLGTLAKVTKLTITAGTVTTDDWKSLKTTLPALQTFAIADVPAVTGVADIPDEQTFPDTIISVTIPQAITVGNSAFSSCSALTTLKLPANPPTVADANAFTDGADIRNVVIVDASGKELTGDALKAAQEAYDRTDPGITGGSDTDGLWYGWQVDSTAGRITIKVNDTETLYKGDSLQKAFEASRQSDSRLSKLIITQGFMTTEDWKWLVNRSSRLNYFEILDTVYLVNNLPNAVSASEPSFPALRTFIVPQEFEVGAYAFSWNYNLTTVKLPKATLIGVEAFKQCSNLTSLDLPKAKTLLSEALYYCTKLKTLSLPKVTYFSGKDSLSYIRGLTLKLSGSWVPDVTADFADTYFSSGDIILVDEYGAELTGDALKDAINLYKADKGYNAEDNEWYAWRLPELPKITITVNGGATPYGGADLKAAVAASKVLSADITALKITAGEVTAEDWNWLKTLNKLTDFTIDASIADGKVANIPNGSDSSPIFPESIIKATIPQTITVGNYAFAYCGELTTVSLPKATKIGDYAFISCKTLKNVSLPKATDIGKFAFQSCAALTTLVLPEATVINEMALSACTALASVSLPNVTFIDNYAFTGDTAFVTLMLSASPPTVTDVNAFSSCPPIRSLTFVGADGTTELIGADLTTAQERYRADRGYNIQTDKWYGWNIGSSFVTVSVTGVALNNTALSLEAGKSETLVATVAPANATNKAATWTSSAPAVATVDANGKVTAVAVGSATITVTTTDGSKTATCAVTVTAVAIKPAPGGKLEAPLTQDKVDDVFGEGNATLDNTQNPPKITLDNSITPEKPIEIETDVTIDLGGNTITGKPGQPGLIVGGGDKVTIGGGGTISGGDDSSGAGGNGITGGVDSDITIDKDTTVEGGDGTSGGDGINSDGNVIVDGTVNGGNGSSGNGGDGVDTSGSTGNIIIKPDGSVTGGNSTGGNGNGGNGTSSGGNTTVDGDVNGGNGNGSGNGGNGANGTGGGNSNIEINNGGSATGGNGGNNGGVGGDGINNNFGDVTVSDGGTATGGNGGNGATGGAGGDGIDSGTGTVQDGGKADGGNGGDGTNIGGNGGDGSNSSGKGEIDGSVTGGNGGNGGITGGNGGDGAASGTGSGAGDIDIGGSATGGNGGGGTTGGTGGDGAITGGDINVEADGSASGGSGGSGTTDGGNGGNGANTTDGGTTVNGDTNGGNGGNSTGNGNGGDGGNGVNQGAGTVGGNGTSTGGNGGNAAGTGNGGVGGSGVGGGANPGSVTTVNGVNGRKAIADVDDSKSGTTVKVADESKLINAALTEAEKQDPTISEVKVVLNVEKKTNQPDKPEVEKTLSMVPANTIGAFFDITLDKIITNASGVQPPVVVANASEEIEITITIPSDIRGGSNYVVIRVHNGIGAALVTTQSGDNLTFKTDKFSTYAIAYTPSGTTPPTPPTPPTDGDNSGNLSQSYFYITATAGVGGSINTPERVKVRPGESAGFTIIPNKGYQIAEVLINGKSIGAKNYYAFTNVLSDQTIHATFKKASHLNPQTGLSACNNIE